MEDDFTEGFRDAVHTGKPPLSCKDQEVFGVSKNYYSSKIQGEAKVSPVLKELHTNSFM